MQVKADVTAANGTAGGVTATNFGTIGQDSELESSSSVSGCTITGTSESIGAVAAYNGKHATIRNVKLAENANVRFSTPAVTIGGLAGMNDGTVTGCQVENGALALNAGLRAGTNTVTLAARWAAPRSTARSAKPTFCWTLHKILINIQIWAASQAKTTVPWSSVPIPARWAAMQTGTALSPSVHAAPAARWEHCRSEQQHNQGL